MILGFDSSIGGPRFDEETVNSGKREKPRGGFTTNHSAIKSFTVKAPNSLLSSRLDSQ